MNESNLRLIESKVRMNASKGCEYPSEGLVSYTSIIFLLVSFHYTTGIALDGGESCRELVAQIKTAELTRLIIIWALKT